MAAGRSPNAEDDEAPVLPPDGSGRLRARFGRARAQVGLALALVRLKAFDTDTPNGRSNERYRRIALTTISSLAARVAGTLVGLVSVPLVLSHLGKDRFGLWSTITTVVAWVGLFDLGIASGLVNLVSRAHGRDDREEARRYVSTAFALLLGVAAALGVVVALAGPLVPWSAVFAVRGAADDGAVTWAVLAALGTLVVGMPLSVVPQIYAGYQRSYVTNAFALAGIVIGFGVLLLAVKGGAGLPALVLAVGIGGVLASAAGWMHAAITMPWLRFRPSVVSLDAARGLMSRSFPLFLFQVGALAVNETQAIVIAHRCNLATVAEYAILMKLYVLVIVIVQASTASFVPAFREAHERGDLRWLSAAFRKFVQLRMLLAVSGGLGFVVLGNPLLRLWLRRSDIAFSTQIWSALGVMMVAAIWTTAYTDLLSILDRLWVLVVLVGANGVVTIALSYWLAAALGILGVVLASGAFTVALNCWLAPLLGRSILRESEKLEAGEQRGKA